MVEFWPFRYVLFLVSRHSQKKEREVDEPKIIWLCEFCPCVCVFINSIATLTRKEEVQTIMSVPKETNFELCPSLSLPHTDIPMS